MNVNSEFTSICEKAVRAGGQVLLQRLGRVSVREKGQADLVTEADLASQELIRTMILDAFPQHAFLGEEELSASKPAATRSDYRWILDPLDGTTNFVHQVPHFSVSLALERAGELLVAAVYHPGSEECFTAVRGQGACLNGRPIHTSRVTTLAGALVAVGFPTVVAADSPDLKAFVAVVQACQSVRRMGSAALNLAYVAAGRFDGCWSFSTKPWDAAAGTLLIREAGGVVTGPTGAPFSLDSGHFLAAANAQLHAQLCLLIAKAGE